MGHRPHNWPKQRFSHSRKLCAKDFLQLGSGPVKSRPTQSCEHENAKAEPAVKQHRTYDNGYHGTEHFPEYIDHYLYFPTQEQADLASAQLLLRGWLTRVSPAALGSDWLLLATQPATGEEEMGDLYQQLSDFAERCGGHYDGWERPMDDDGDESLN